MGEGAGRAEREREGKQKRENKEVLFSREGMKKIAAFLLLFLFVGSASRHYKKKREGEKKTRHPNFTPPPSCRSGTPPSRASAPGSAPSRSRSTANAACPTDP